MFDVYGRGLRLAGPQDKPSDPPSVHKRLCCVANELCIMQGFLYNEIKNIYVV